MDTWTGQDTTSRNSPYGGYKGNFLDLVSSAVHVSTDGFGRDLAQQRSGGSPPPRRSRGEVPHRQPNDLHPELACSFREDEPAKVSGELAPYKANPDALFEKSRAMWDFYFTAMVPRLEEIISQLRRLPT